jgi:hypothetical protein
MAKSSTKGSRRTLVSLRRQRRHSFCALGPRLPWTPVLVDDSSSLRWLVNTSVSLWKTKGLRLQPVVSADNCNSLPSKLIVTASLCWGAIAKE